MPGILPEKTSRSVAQIPAKAISIKVLPGSNCGISLSPTLKSPSPCNTTARMLLVSIQKFSWGEEIYPTGEMKNGAMI